MTVVPVVERMTAEKFLELPVPQRGRPWNLVNGEVVVNDSSWLHQRVVGELLFALEIWARAEAGRGEVSVPLDVRLDDRNVFAPDLLWYAEGRAPARLAPPPYPMPDIAVEVRSPSTWRYDIGQKKSGYERHGLPELWLLDTAGEVVLVFRRTKADSPTFDIALELEASDRLTSPQLEGFAVAVGALFPPR